MHKRYKIPKGTAANRCTRVGHEWTNCILTDKTVIYTEKDIDSQNRFWYIFNLPVSCEWLWIEVKKEDVNVVHK